MAITGPTNCGRRGTKRRLLPIFVLDEAHVLHQDTLAHLHILLNYAWESRALP